MRDDQPFDVVIVGSGAGGSAAAWRLATAGLKVALVEKGGELPQDGSTLDVKAVVHEGRYKAREPWRDRDGRPFEPEEWFNVGGKTRWYGAALLRYAPTEFAAEPAHQCRGWPVAYADLRDHYAQAEHMLGVREFECESALARIVRRLEPGGWRTAPLPMALDPAILGHRHEALHFDGFASVAGLKGDAVRAFLAPLRGRPNFVMLEREPAIALVGDPVYPARVIGVRTAAGRTLRAPRVLLAAGALHTPRLAQRYLRASGLEHSLPAARSVGRNLKLHLLTAIVALGPGRQADLLRKTVLFTHPDLPHSSVQPLGFDGELIATLMPALLPRPVARALGERAYGFFLQTEDGSHPDNRVIDAGACEPPVLDYDARRLAPALAEHRRLLRRLRGDLLRAGLVPFSRRIGLGGTAHACGTMVAGEDPADSVVDRAGRVYGLDGLYVVDGSVLPRSSRVNPSLSIYAWSLHVAAGIVAASRSQDSAPATAAGFA